MSRDRILVVDDDPGIRHFLSDALGLRGYHVLTTVGGRAALRLIDEHDPHLVLLDIATAACDGIETLHRIHTERPALPVVILTAYADVATASRALAHGAADYVTKPFDLGYLEQVIAAHLGAERQPAPSVIPLAAAARPALQSIPGGRR
jgi:DNA-binding NtrC family response regulator